MTVRKHPAPAYDHEISMLFSLLSLVLFATLASAVLFYAEPFMFWQHAFSDLGNTVTQGGHPNAASRMIFSVGMIIDSAVMLRIGACYARNERLRHHTIKRWLAFLGALGFLVSIYPNDINHVTHSVGVGMVIGVVYLFVMILHIELKPLISARLFIVDLVMIQAAVFAYAAAFFAGSASKQVFQKTCILGVFLGLERIVTAAEEGFQLREVLGFMQRPER